MCCFQVQALLSAGSEPQVVHLPDEGAGPADLSGSVLSEVLGFGMQVPASG